jgi:hypothetical protein
MAMRHKLIPFLFIFVFAGAHAAPVYKVSSSSTRYIPSGMMQNERVQNNWAMQSHMVMAPSGAQYSSPVYEPFDNTTPSQLSESAATGSSKPSGPRRGKILGPDTDPAQQYPIGEPWILLLFAILMAGGIAVRKRKNTTL